jgi:hypothetical protein
MGSGRSRYWRRAVSRNLTLHCMAGLAPYFFQRVLFLLLVPLIEKGIRFVFG